MTQPASSWSARKAADGSVRRLYRPSESVVAVARGTSGTLGTRAVAGGLRKAVTSACAGAPGTVTPSERAAEVDRLVTLVPLPPGFDPAPLRTARGPRAAHQIVAEVAGAAACGWLDDSTAARTAGDDSRADESLRTLREAKTWPLLADAPDFADTIASSADRIAEGDPTGVGESNLRQYCPRVGPPDDLN